MYKLWLLQQVFSYNDNIIYGCCKQDTLDRDSIWIYVVMCSYNYKCMSEGKRKKGTNIARIVYSLFYMHFLCYVLRWVLEVTWHHQRTDNTAAP